ncbi:MAG TPA: winged helix-turn-helix domain-containing protein [Candidatus Acidoferrales bacterium]|nr:winged helix-turn-helix domain-containing protein [Candidatus Acidoferrales bacterium]
MSIPETYEFGDFLLEASERRLSRNGQPVPLSPKAFDLLAALAGNPGRLLPKRELLDLVWPASFVEEGILAVHVSALRKALGEGYIQTVSRAGYRFTATVVRGDPGPDFARACTSIAVLPSRRVMAGLLSGRERATGLAIADALIDRLGRLPGVLIRPTRAIQEYADHAEDAAATGRGLQVDAVLESTLLAAGDGIGISAGLIRSRDGVRLWSGDFRQPDSDVSALIEALTDSIASRLRPDRAVASRPRRIAHPEVYEWFGQGRAHLLSASLFEVPKAIEAFQAALRLEPEYAAAHAGLALAYCAQAELRLAPATQAYGEARAAALRALAMDDTCADAQVALGAVLFLSDWNWSGARRSLERALDINPNHTEAYLLYGRLLEALGELAAGLEMKLRALERDPFSPLVHVQIALAYFHQRSYGRAIEWANKALELDPRHLLAREVLAGAYLKAGDFDRHMAEALRHAESAGAPPAALEPLRQMYAAGGRRAIVNFAIDQASRNDTPSSAIVLAIHHAEAGNLDAAFHHLDRAMESHDPSLVHLAVAPQWDEFRADPRFDACLARMGLRTGSRLP